MIWESKTREDNLKFSMAFYTMLIDHGFTKRISKSISEKAIDSYPKYLYRI